MIFPPFSVTSAGFGASAPFTPDAISDGAFWIDAEDYSSGSVTTLVDRFHGHVFTGSGTRATNVGGGPSIDFNGTSTGYVSNSVISQINGASALTWILIGTGATGGTSGYILEHGTFAGAAGTAGVYQNWATARLHQQLWNTAQAEYFLGTESMAGAAIWSGSMDFRRYEYEAGMMRKNGAQQASSLFGNPVQAFTATLGNHLTSIGRRVAGGSNFWSGKLRAILCYSRALQDSEIRQIEEFYAPKVGVTLNAERAPLGDLFLFGGQSNMVGQDTNYVPYGTPWPPADTSARLKKYNGAATLIAAVEPHGGIGGSPMTPCMDAIARDARFAGDIVSALFCQNGLSIANFQRGQAMYNTGVSYALSMIARGYTPRALFWYQGENDTLSTDNRDNYKARTLQFFSHYREDVQLPNLSIVMCKLHSTQPNAGWPYWHDVRTLQDEVAAVTSNLSLIPSGGTLMGDNLHLTSQASINLGVDMATTYLTTLG